MPPVISRLPCYVLLVELGDQLTCHKLLVKERVVVRSGKAAVFQRSEAISIKIRTNIV